MAWRGIQIHLGWPSSRIWRNSGRQVAPHAVPSVHLGQGFWLMMWWHTCLVGTRGTIKVSCSSKDSRWITTARRKSCHWMSWMRSRCVWASSRSSVSRFITMVRSRKCFTGKKTLSLYVLPKWQHVRQVMSISQSAWTTFMNESQLRSIVTPHNFVLPINFQVLPHGLPFQRTIWKETLPKVLRFKWSSTNFPLRQTDAILCFTLLFSFSAIFFFAGGG